MPQEKHFRGIAVTPSIAVGRAWVLPSEASKPYCAYVSPEEVSQEQLRFQNAIWACVSKLQQLQQRFQAGHAGGSSQILTAYELMLQDPLLIEGVEQRITQKQYSAEHAIRETLQEILSWFDENGDAYLLERRQDIDVIGRQLLEQLTETPVSYPKEFPENTVLVAPSLSPAELLQNSPQFTAIVTETGSYTSHTSILARSLALPSLVGVEAACEHLSNGDLVLLDGFRGELVQHPSPARVEEALSRKQQYVLLCQQIQEEQEHHAVSTIPITFQINAEFLSDIPALHQQKASGIGLLRTEFLFLDRDEFPSEEEHFLFLQKILQQAAPHPVTVRTVDLGGDKLFREGTPRMFSGLRGIRLCLAIPSLFRSQLRGVLRAASFGNLRLMFPLVTSLDEFLEAKQYVLDVWRELREEGHEVPSVPIGVMIETPAAVSIAELLATEADFFCLGTNDLIQYTMAAERSDEIVATYYQPLHPAIFRMLRHTIAVAKRAEIPVSVCGEMATDPVYAAVLFGLGCDALSMHASALPLVRYVLRRLLPQEAQALVAQLAAQKTTSAIEQTARAWLLERLPTLTLSAHFRLKT